MKQQESTLDIDDVMSSLKHHLETDPEVPSVELLRLRPGDILTFNTDNWLSDRSAEMVRDQLVEMVPKGVHIAILEGGARFTVVRPEEEK